MVISGGYSAARRSAAPIGEFLFSLYCPSQWSRAAAARRKAGVTSRVASIVSPVRRSTDRILTTHVGSLPRPKELLDLMRAKLNGQGEDFEYQQQVSEAVQESVRQQVQP